MPLEDYLPQIDDRATMTSSPRSGRGSPVTLPSGRLSLSGPMLMTVIPASPWPRCLPGCPTCCCIAWVKCPS